MPPLSPQQTKAARALLGWTASDLAEKAALSIDTLRSFESTRTRTLSGDNEAKAREALIQAGVQFLAAGDAAEGVGVCLRIEGASA